MATRPTPVRTARAGVEIGQHLTAWRKLLGLTAEQVSERAGVSRNALRRLENGELGGMDTFLNVVRALGQLDRLVTSLDPYETDLGRARADQALPQRVRR
ncbi:MAG: helix-turn-helix transcriptional regulator [Actinobacteria bacterium]|nr:helix-turn-helix transcriptional regulator [Actinomycetota bacterium]